MTVSGHLTPHGQARSSDIGESLADYGGNFPGVAIPIRCLLARDAARRPGNCDQAFGIDGSFAFKADAKSPGLNSLQGSFHVPQQGGLTIDISNRKVTFRRILDLVHLVRASLNCDSIALAQCAGEFGFFSLENVTEFVRVNSRYVHDDGGPVSACREACLTPVAVD
jgi:hypothetical protein